MLITFLAPGFAWQGSATHDEIAHASTAPAPHDQDHGPADHDDEAHGVIGHLLGHLPAFVSSLPTLPVVAPAPSSFVEAVVQWPRVAPEPPLRPPRLFS
jgi:hypothetical protein